MTLPEFSVKRRITITMFILIITLFGVISFTNLGLDLLPELEFPFVSVVTTYEGVGSEEVETLITKYIEQAVSTVEGIKEVTSLSSEGISSVYIEFEWGTNLDFAAQDVREKLNWITDFMPTDADTPMVLKFNASDMPILEYGVTGMDNTLRLRDYLDDTVRPRLERLEGIASVYIWGGKEREIQVQLDPNKLKATGISLQQVTQAIQAGNLNLSGGHVETLQREYLIRTTGYYDSLEEIRNTIVSVTDKGKPVHLRDLAVIKDDFVELRGYERTNREPTVILAIMKQSGYNTLQAVNLVKAEMESMQKDFPESMDLKLVFDQGEFIQKSISSTGYNALLGGVIAVFVVYIFLRAFRPTLTIALAIPLSVITTFIGMNALGYTFNIMTLGGIALGVGLLVDNAVVVIENTFRHLESGSPRETSAILGANEVGLAITASTLTTMAVFLPMSLSQSIAGKLARPLSFTVCIALLASLFVAVTIIPAIAATIFKKEKTVTAALKGKGWTLFIRKRYAEALAKSLNHKGKILIGAFLSLVAAIAIVPVLGTEFMPRQDVPMALLDITLPVGTVLAETDHLTQQIENLFLEREEVITCVSMVGITSGAKYQTAQGEGVAGVNSARVFVRFVDIKDRDKSADTIINEIRERFPDLEGVDYRFQDISGGFFGSSGSPIEINLYGADLDTLNTLSAELIERLKNVEGLKDLESSLKKSKPEIHIKVDREKASKLGLSVYQIAANVETAMLGKVISRYHEAGKESDIKIRFQEPYRENIEGLLNITIQNPLGNTISLSQVAALNKDYGPITINRKNQERVVTVSGTNFERDLGSIARDVQDNLKGLTIPEGYFYEIGGAYEDLQTSFVELSKAFVIAIILIYMIMAAQFESLTQPLIVMFTLPLAFIGVVLGLFITGKSLSVPSFMGLVILMGIVVNNGIVMIDYINHLRARGMHKLEAIIEGASIRLRPILITSVTTICGMFPMAFSTGEGSEMRSPMAVAVAFGLLFAMVLTLFVVPSAYAIIDSISARVLKKTDTLVNGTDQ
ncbi:MAG: efflux RND transporter permease subunit [Deltaproteobacteria bacterium]|nr:efflux RND transporter permease subunit [Deltaproteobacteria bacterium]